MNNELLRNVIKKQCPSVRRYEIRKKAVIYTSLDGKTFVAKKNNKNNILNTYNYLNSRGFGYVPRLVYQDNDAYVYEYVNDCLTPSEQRISDVIKMDALLHNKTVYYKETSLDEVKEIYEKLNEKIDDVFNYYDELVTKIESFYYASPSEYLLIRNCSMIFSCLDFCKRRLEKWYEIASNKNKKREVLLHNNLDPSHLIRNDENILISWDYAVRDLPIYDFIKLYKNNYDKYDFSELYKEYSRRFPLLEEERLLMFVILFIPWKIEFDSSELKTTTKVGKLYNYLFTTDRLFMENEAKNTKEQNHYVNEQ
jgi:hypothetical protein